VNSRDEVLLSLRDDKPEIPYPGRWDLLGGHIETGETPAQCIAREIQEEIGRRLAGPALFQRYDLPDRVEWMFWERAEVDVAATVLTEGQRLEWFSAERIASMPDDAFAFGFRRLLLEFFALRPFAGPRSA
jgi:8-oxo-dGTP diphosphatase